ncbi:MAG: hypothetical protein KH054_11410 [Firmicutes bacterium]|nr:hypothetical protein [Bacillota bacterium]
MTKDELKEFQKIMELQKQLTEEIFCFYMNSQIGNELESNRYNYCKSDDGLLQFQPSLFTRPTSQEKSALFEEQKRAPDLIQTIKKPREINVLSNKKEDSEEETKERGILKFTFEEIKKMPKKLHFFIDGLVIYYRKRQTGKYTYSYNVRFKRCGYDIDFSEKKKENLKARFIEEIKKQDKEQRSDKIPTSLNQFSLYYFDNFRAKKVTAETLKKDMSRYKNYIAPYFKEILIKNITPSQCQKLLDEVPGNGKTADEIYSLMNCIFKCAIAHHIIQFSPMDTVLHIQHERESGIALTKEEEQKLLQEAEKTNYRLAFAIALYTGLRPNEYQSAKIEGNFIVAINSKRKNRKIEYKKIPVTPMLRPYLERVTIICFPELRHIRNVFKKILPNHKLYDLRTTFYTRCKECGIADAARNEFVGHSMGKLENAYTDLSDEFLLREGEKFSY